MFAAPVLHHQLGYTTKRLLAPMSGLSASQNRATFLSYTKEIIMAKSVTLPVREKNEHIMAARIAFLSRALAAQSLASSEELDGTLGDGLAQSDAR